MTVEYDGTDYFGWQMQPDVPTVQGEILSGLRAFLKTEFKVVGASRTDRGVHARGQVVSLKIPGTDDPDRVKAALNGNLPRDIYVREVKPAQEGFDARRSAKGKRYTYTVHMGRSPLSRRFAWEYAGPDLDVESLNSMASSLVGKRDMRSLSPGHPEPDATVEIFTSFWEQKGNFLIFTVEGNRFLYRLVRNMVGLMMAEAGKRIEPGTLNKALAGERVRIITAPPQGLCLEEVFY